MDETTDETLLAVQSCVEDVVQASQNPLWAVTICEATWLNEGLVITAADIEVWRNIAALLRRLELSNRDAIPLVLENCAEDTSVSESSGGVFFETTEEDQQQLPSVQIPRTLLASTNATDGSEVIFRLDVEPRAYPLQPIRVAPGANDSGLATAIVKGLAAVGGRPRTLPALLQQLRQSAPLCSAAGVIREEDEDEAAGEAADEDNCSEGDMNPFFPLPPSSSHNNSSSVLLEESREAIKSDVSATAAASGSNLLPGLATSSRYRRDFEEICCLGRGGFGCVMKCRLSAVANPNSEDVFAVKVIGLQGDDKACGALLREAATIAALQHPNIVRYYSAWVETEQPAHTTAALAAASESSQEPSSAGRGLMTAIARTPTKRLFILMECCTGQTLRDIIEAGGLWQKATCIWKLFKQILLALEFMHSRELMHRDLKPCNIFLQPVLCGSGEQDLLVRVGDFGLTTSFAIPQHAPEARLSAGVGTKLYMAPEQEAGGAYDAKVDVYALGVVFFEMWHPPFKTAMERTVVLDRVRHGVLPPEYYTDLPSQVPEILELLLQQDPTKRPAASELLRSPLIPRIQDDAFDTVYDVLTRPTGLVEASLIAAELSMQQLKTTALPSKATAPQPDGCWLWLEAASLAQRTMINLCRERGALPALLPPLLPRQTEQGDAVALLDNSGFPLRLTPSLISAAVAVASHTRSTAVLKRFCIGPLARGSSLSSLTLQVRGCFFTSMRMMHEGAANSTVRDDGRESNDVHDAALQLCGNNNIARAALRLLFYAAPRGLVNRSNGVAKHLRTNGRLEATTWLLNEWMTAHRRLAWILAETVAVGAQCIRSLIGPRVGLCWTHLLLLPALIASFAPRADPSSCFEAAAAMVRTVNGGLNKKALLEALVTAGEVDKKTAANVVDNLMNICTFHGSLRHWIEHAGASNPSHLVSLLLATVTRLESILATACPSLSDARLSFTLFLKFDDLPNENVFFAYGLAYTFFPAEDSSNNTHINLGDSRLGHSSRFVASFNGSQPLAFGGQLVEGGCGRSRGENNYVYFSALEVNLGSLARLMVGLREKEELGTRKAVFVMPNKPSLHAHAVMLRHMLRRDGLNCVRSFEAHCDPQKVRGGGPRQPSHHLLVVIRETPEGGVTYRVERRDGGNSTTELQDPKKVVEFIKELASEEFFYPVRRECKRFPLKSCEALN